MKRKLTPDELNLLEQEGYDTSSYKGELVEFPDPPPTSALAAGGRAALANAIPATAGAAGFAGGMAASAPLAAAAAPVIGPFAAAIPIIGGIVAGAGTSAATRTIQDMVTPDAVNEILAKDAAEHPTAARLGALGASLLTMRPSLSVTKDAIKGVPGLIAGDVAGASRAAMTPASRAALANVTLGAGINTATEGGRQVLSGDLDMARLGEEALIGAAFNKPTPLGRKVMRLPATDVGPRDVDLPDVRRAQLGTVRPKDVGAEHVNAYRDTIARQTQFNESAVEMARESLAKQAEVNAQQAAELARVKQNQDDLMGAISRVLDEGVPAPKPVETAPKPVEELPTRDPVMERLRVTPEESAQDLEMRQIEARLSGEPRPRYSEELPATPREQEMQDMMAAQKLPTAPNPIFNRGTDALLQSKNIGVRETTNIPQKGTMRPSGAEREVLINPKKETVDTRPHEGLHYEIQEIELDASRGNAKAKKFLDELYKKQDEALRAYNEKAAKAGLKPIDAHEFATTEQGADFMIQQLNLKKEGEWKKWWNDSKALFNTKFGRNPSVADMQRALSYRFLNRTGELGTLGQRGPLGKVPNPSGAVAGPLTRNSGMSPEEGFNTREGDDVWSNPQEDVEVRDLTNLNAKEKQVKARLPFLSDENMKVTVQNVAEIPEAGYVQIDEMHPKLGNTFSSNAETLNKLGYKVPTTQELKTLPNGQYTLAEARQLLQRRNQEEGRGVKRTGEEAEVEQQIKAYEAGNPKRFWMTSSGEMRATTEHYKGAKEILGDTTMPFMKAYEEMFNKGNLRVVENPREIVFEGTRPSRKQIAELKNIAIEKRKMLIHDSMIGPKVLFDPAFDQEAGRGVARTEADDRPFMTSAERVVKDTIKGPVSGEQALNTIKNKVPPGEWELLKEMGIENAFTAGKRVTPSELDTWLKENGPRVELHSYGMEGKVSESVREYERLSHEWYDTLDISVRNSVDRATSEAFIRGKENNADFISWRLQAIDDFDGTGVERRNFIQTLDKYIDVTTKSQQEIAKEQGPRATSAYEGVSAFNTREPMPEWTTSKEGKNVQRVDVVIPQKLLTNPKYGEYEYRGHDKVESALWQPDGTHENLPNTLGWAMIQYKTGPKGEKIAFIAEAQSRWGQSVREAKKKVATAPESAYDSPFAQRFVEQANNDHPLLKDYNRLILKAAIEQARKEGATHIAVSDMPSAMISEHLDTNARFVEKKFDTEAAAENEVDLQLEDMASGDYSAPSVEQDGGKWVVRIDKNAWDAFGGVDTLRGMGYKLEREAGFEFNYDTALPRIAEELTGGKGEKVSLGEHKNAMDGSDYETSDGNLLPRKNLIFKNPDGTPKTDVSGTMYPLGKAATKEQPFSLFERRSSEAERGVTRTEGDGGLEIDTSRKSFLRPMEATFDKVERVSVPHAQAARNYETRKDQYIGMGNVALDKLSRFDRDTLNNVMAKHREAYRTETEPVFNDPTEQEISSALREYFGAIGDIRREIGLRINNRQAGKNEYYVPDMMSAKTLDTLINNPLSPESKYIKNLWAEHVMKETGGKANLATVKKDINEYVEALNGKNNNYRSLEFGAIRRAAGYGLPAELRDMDIVNTLTRYSRRAAADLAFFQEIQSKPEIAGPLHIKSQSGTTFKGYEDSALPQSEHIQNMMQWITGNVSGRLHRQPKINALIRLVNNSLLGTATGVRDLVSVPLHMVPYLHQFSDLGAAWKGLTDVRKNSMDALRTGARQPSIDRVQFSEMMDAPDRFSTAVGKAADLMRRVQGREALENFSRDVTFSIGKELARNNVYGARNGNKKSEAWLKKFGDLVEGDVKTLEGQDFEAALNQIAKNFTDRNQGTYGGRGLPLGMVDSTFAPFLSLQKWSVEKANVIYKDVYKPFITGENRLPMLTYTLGSLMTGAAIQQLNELLSGRKGQDPTIKEALAKGDAASIAQELFTIMQLGSYAGIISDTMKTVADVSIRGRAPRNVVSFPTATATIRTTESLSDFAEAIRQGENPWEVLKAFSLDLAVNNVQLARMLANHTIKEEDVERTDKFRDVRVFNELEGEPAKNYVPTNRYLGMTERKFKRTGDLGEAAQLGQEAVQRAVRKGEGNPEEIRKSLRGLKANSYQTMPSPENRPDAFKKYYDYLVETQGEEAAQERLLDFVRQSRVNRAKSRMIP